MAHATGRVAAAGGNRQRHGVRVPFRDLRRGVALDRAGWEPRVLDAIAGGEYQWPSEQVLRFEERFAEWCGVRHAIATSSGTTAVLLACLALEIPAGSELVSVANTYVASIEPALLLGAKPVLVDIEREGYGIDPDALARAITPRTAAVVPFHPFGRMADVVAVRAIADEHGVPMLEEACQAHGACRDSRRAGTWGDVGVFSFGPTKSFAGIGEGGAVTTNSDRLAERARLWNDHGRVDGRHVTTGLNLRMHPIEAAFLTHRLDGIDAALEERRSIAAIYNRAFMEFGIVRNPRVQDLAEHSYYVYVVDVDDRDNFMAKLASHGIETAVHYQLPIHRQAAHRDLAEPGSLRVTDEVNARIVSLPLFPGITSDEVEAVVAAVREACGSRR